MIDGTPPLVGFLLVGEAFLVELEEAPLGPFVIFGVGGVDFARPVDGESETLGLLAEIADVLLGYFLGGDAGLDGVVFSGEAESIIAKGAHDIETLLGVKPGKSVNYGKVTDVTDVKASSRGVGEHFSEEHLRTIGDFGGLIRTFGVPDGLPFLFDFEGVLSIHVIYYTTLLLCLINYV